MFPDGKCVHAGSGQQWDILLEESNINWGHNFTQSENIKLPAICISILPSMFRRKVTFCQVEGKTHVGFLQTVEWCLFPRWSKIQTYLNVLNTAKSHRKLNFEDYHIRTGTFNRFSGSFQCNFPIQNVYHFFLVLVGARIAIANCVLVDKRNMFGTMCTRCSLLSIVEKCEKVIHRIFVSNQNRLSFK